MVTSGGQFIIVIWHSLVLVARLVSEGLVEVFSSEAEAIGRGLVLLRLRVILRSTVLLQFTGYTIDGKVVVHQMEVAGLDLLEHVVTKLADEAVVVFTFHMHDKFFVTGLSALGEGHHFLKSDRSLESYSTVKD